MKRKRQDSYEFFGTPSTAAERAEEENRDGTSEENAGCDLDRRRVVCGGENGRRTEWKLDGTLLWCGGFGDLGEP